jgi:hypothetical protein
MKNFLSSENPISASPTSANSQPVNEVDDLAQCCSTIGWLVLMTANPSTELYKDLDRRIL